MGKLAGHASRCAAPFVLAVVCGVGVAAGVGGSHAARAGEGGASEPAEPLWTARAYSAGNAQEDWDMLPPACICTATRTAAVCLGRSCQLRRLPDGGLVRSFGPHDYEVAGAALSPDGKLLACFQNTAKAYRFVRMSIGGGYEPIKPERDIHLVFLWETETGKLRFRLRSHSANVWQLVFSPDGTRLLSFAHGNQACFWDTTSGDLLARLDGPNSSSLTADFPGAAWAKFGGLLPGDLLVATANELVEYGEDGHRARGDPLASVPGEYSGGLLRERSGELAVSNGRVIALNRVIAQDNPEFWNEWQAKFPPLPEHEITADWKAAFHANQPRTVWYTRQPLSLARFKLGQYVGTLLDRANSYRDIAFTPDGRLLASTRCSGKINEARELVLWDVASEKQVFGPPAVASKLYSLASATSARYIFTPDSQWLLYGAYKARFFNVKTLKWFRPRHEVEIIATEGHEGVGGRFEISSDGEYLLGAGFGGEIRVWRFPPILQDLVEINGPLPPETE